MGLGKTNRNEGRIGCWEIGDTDGSDRVDLISMDSVDDDLKLEEGDSIEIVDDHSVSIRRVIREIDGREVTFTESVPGGYLRTSNARIEKVVFWEREIFRFLPRVLREYDNLTVGSDGREAAGDLERFLSVFAREMDRLDVKVDELHDLLNVDRVPRKWLPLLAQYLGVELDGNDNESEQRSFLRNAYLLRLWKGTQLGLDYYLSNLGIGARLTQLYSSDYVSFTSSRVSESQYRTPHVQIDLDLPESGNYAEEDIESVINRVKRVVPIFVVFPEAVFFRPVFRDDVEISEEFSMEVPGFRVGIESVEMDDEVYFVVTHHLGKDSVEIEDRVHDWRVTNRFVSDKVEIDDRFVPGYAYHFRDSIDAFGLPLRGVGLGTRNPTDPKSRVGGENDTLVISTVTT